VVRAGGYQAFERKFNLFNNKKYHNFIGNLSAGFLPGGSVISSSTQSLKAETGIISLAKSG